MSTHRISSAKFLWGIAGALLFLTFLTVAVTWFYIPEPWNVIVAILIATVKATLVGAFFMNLYWDSKFNLLVLLTAFAFLALLMLISLTDSLFRAISLPSLQLFTLFII